MDTEATPSLIAAISAPKPEHGVNVPGRARNLPASASSSDAPVLDMPSGRVAYAEERRAYEIALTSLRDERRELMKLKRAGKLDGRAAEYLGDLQQQIDSYEALLEPPSRPDVWQELNAVATRASLTLALVLEKAQRAK